MTHKHLMESHASSEGGCTQRTTRACAASTSSGQKEYATRGFYVKLSLDQSRRAEHYNGVKYAGKTLP